MSALTIVDAGPLAAFFVKTDRHHRWAKASFTAVAPPLLTCEAAVSEACFLLRRSSVGPERVLELMSRDLLAVDFSISSELGALQKIMLAYADQGVSLADACLVRMSELHENCRVMTLDRDFLVYRRFGRRQIPLLAPFA